MRKSAIAIAVIAIALAVVGGAVAFRVSIGGDSGNALAASQDETGVFSSVASGLTENEMSDTPWLGVRLVRTSDGLTVAAVVADSPADKAGLQRGDVITAVDGTAVSDAKALIEAVEGKAAGDSITLSITRNGSAQEIVVTLEARPEPLAQANPILPELEGITHDQLYGHMLGGSFQFTDKDSNSHTATVELGTVSAVDTNARTLTVDLNAGGSKTYTIDENVVAIPQDLSQFESGDRVTVISVDDDVRVIVGGRGMMVPFFGIGKGFRFGCHGGAFGLEVPDDSGDLGPDTSDRGDENGLNTYGRGDASGL